MASSSLLSFSSKLYNQGIQLSTTSVLLPRQQPRHMVNESQYADDYVFLASE